ncbi:uncharacterized protein [Ptychodera flava]|uniref:uncharacterized protein n=1 Tax=Ptychodera flava TaxID=63121 RepID=UPI00396A7833
MPTLQALLKRREKAKFLLIGHLEPIEDLIRQHDTTTTKSKDYHEIITGKPTLDRKLESLLTVCQELYDQLDISHAEFGTTADLERAISARYSSVAVFIDTVKAAEQVRTTAAQQVNTIDTSQQPIPTQQNRPATPYKTIQLPKLEIPIFYGDYRQWNQFFDNFQSAIDDNEHLSDVQKFVYLRSFLGGEAKRTIDGFATTDANYATAVKLLKERYGRTQLIINAHMRYLWEQPPPSNNPESLRQFHDELETTIRELNVMGKNENDFSKLLIPMLLEKLPKEFQMQLARGRSDDSWTLSGLTKAMTKEIRVLSVGSKLSELSTVDGDNTPTVSAFYTKTARGSNHTTTGFNRRKSHTTTPAKRSPPTQRKCAFCSGQHSPNNCIKISEPSQRLEIVKRDHLCFNCLGKHSANYCKSRFTCRVCKQRHHTALHDESKVRSTSPNSDSKANQASVNFTHASRDTTSTEHMSPPPRILLKTAKIRASYRGKEAIANVLFDEGADRSFVTKRFAKSLNANVHNTELLKLKSFNNSHTDYTSVSAISLQLHTPYGKRVLIDLLCVEEISVMTP